MSRRHCISKLQKNPLKVVNINGKDDAIFVNLTSSIVQASSSDVHFKCLPLPNSWCNRYNIDRAQQFADQELSEVFNLLDYCVTNNITQPSRVKSEQKLFVIGEDDPQGVHIAFFFLIPQEQYIFLAFLFVNYLVWLSYRNQGWTDKLLFGRMEGREVLMFKQHLYRFPFSHGILYTATTCDILKKDEACPLVSVPVKTINI